MPPVSDSDHRRLEAVVYPDCIVESHQISDASRGWRRVGVTKVWRTERLLGRGGFGEVHLQSQESDKDVKRALKIIPTRGVKLSLADCQRELTAMIEFTKPKYRDAAVFVDFIGWFQNDDAMFLAMEYMPLGDLEQNMKEIEKSAINTESALPEEEVQEITRQILEGLKIMHAEGFAHRDLKPQNVFVVQRHPQWWVKLGDFGLSKKRTDGTAYRTQAGTQEYMAPEIFYYVQELDTETSEYTNAIDMWSLGCIVHRVVTGKVPFLTMLSLRNYCNDQSRVPLNMPPMEEATKFVQALLTPHPAKRPVASAALESPWLTRRNRPNIIMNDPETSFAALKVLQSQDNYNTASHKGLQSNYTMPAGNDPIPDRVKNEPASEPLPSINEPISKVPKAEVQLESQEDVEDHSTVIADGISTFPLPFVKIGDIYTSKPVPNAQDALSGAVIPPVEELNKKGAGHTSEIPATQASPATDPGSAETKPLTMRNKLIVGTLNGKRVVGDSHSEAPVIPKPKPTAINNDNALPLHRHRLENLVDTLLDDEHDDEINIAGKAQPEDKDISSKRVTSLNKNRAGERVAAVQFKISPSPSLDPRSFTTARNLRLILNSYGVAYSPDATKTQLQEILTALIRSPSSVKRRQLDQLPPGWTKCLSHDGRVYYRDGIEHVSTWTDPRTVDIEDFPQTLTGSQMSPLRLKPQESEVAQPSSHTELTLLEVQNINLFSTLIDRLQHFPAGTILHEPRIQLLYDSMGSLLPRLLRNCHEIIKKHDILVNLHAKVSRILRLRHQLSFITAKDQVQFEKLFSSAVGNEQTLSGDKAMEILWRSGLNGDVLSQIWTLADTARAGKLHFPEFALAMYLCNMKLLGKSLPSSLPRNIAIEVWSITDIINGGVANGPFLTALATNTSEINTRKFLAPRPHDLVAPSASNFHWLDSPLEEDPEMRPTLLEQQPQPETVVNLSGSADLLWPSSGIQPLSTSQYEPYEDPQYHRPIYIPPTYKSRQHITDKPQEEPKKSKKGLFSRLLGRQSSELSGNVYRATESIHISVQTLTGIATQVEVGQTETIGDLKDMLHDLKGIPSDQQIITYAGKQLQDYCTIESYHIPDDAILHLVQRQKPKDVTEERRDLIIVNVKAISGKTTFINISAAESVWTLKCMIQDKEGIPTNQQVLIFGGKQLDDQAGLLSGYGILDRSIVYLIEKLHPASTSDLIEVYIKTLAGQTWILNTRQNETISSLKAQIQERQGIPQYRQRLFFMGKVLENNGTLKDYDIQDRSTVYMTLWIESARETIEIDISTRSGKQIKLMASPIETIKSIKGKIRDKEGIPLDLQILIFVGQELEDDRTVEETKIRNGSTIRLVQRLRG